VLKFKRKFRHQKVKDNFVINVLFLFFMKGKFRGSILTDMGLNVFIHFEVRDNSIRFSVRMESLDSYCSTPNTLSMPYQHDVVCFSFRWNEVVSFVCALILFV
jgi:hypothetical protein